MIRLVLTTGLRIRLQCAKTIYCPCSSSWLQRMAWKSPTVLGLDSADTILPNDSYHADHLRICRVTAVKEHLNIMGFRKNASNAELLWTCAALIWDLCLWDIDQRLWIIQISQPTRCNNFPSLLLRRLCTAQHVSGVLTPIRNSIAVGSQISSHSAHEGGKVVSHTHRPPFPPPLPRYLVPISFRGWVDPRVIVRPEGLCQWKIPVTPSEIEPATFRLVAQCLNQLRHRVPLFIK
jgi:hypothetical protein